MNNDDENVKRHKKRKCVFCEWLNSGEDGWRDFLEKEKYRLIYPENEMSLDSIEYIVLLSRDPKVAGHTLVIWKYPYDDICDITNASKATHEQIGEVLSRYSRRLKEELRAEKVYVYSMCDHFEKRELKTEEKDTTEHLHFHLLPRYPGAPKGERLFCLPDKKLGIDWEAIPITLEKLALSIKKHLLKQSSTTSTKRFHTVWNHQMYRNCE